MKILQIVGMLLLCTFISCSEKIPTKDAAKDKVVNTATKSVEDETWKNKRVITNNNESEAAIKDLCSGKAKEKIELNFMDLHQSKEFYSNEYEIENVKGECFAVIKSPFGTNEKIWRRLIVIVKN